VGFKLILLSMKFILSVLALAHGAASSATEYASMGNILAQAPFHTMRLTEIQATVASKSPMDQIGALCYKQSAEISAEIEQLDSNHAKFQSQCMTTLQQYRTQMNELTNDVADNDAKAAEKSVSWNTARTHIPARRTKRERLLAAIVSREKFLKALEKTRAEQKKVYDADMVDFSKALADIDELKKILTNSNLNNKQTSGNVAKQGFLQIIQNTDSDKIRAVSSRLHVGHQSLLESTPSGVDKVMNLLLEVRNEMWKEMDKLTKAEARAVNLYRNRKLQLRAMINAMHLSRARIYIQIGQILTHIGKEMISEADYRKKSAQSVKRLDRIEIDRQFMKASCEAEEPLWSKSRATKLAEIKTIQKMQSILANLNWSGPVYNAIKRVSLTGTGVDGNPEPGYTMGYQMNLAGGLDSHSYEFQAQVKDFSRVAIKLQLGSTWVWTSFDAPTSHSASMSLPTLLNGYVHQRYVTNLHVFGSPSAKVTVAHAARGFVEMWGTDYSKTNTKKVPGASDGLYDGGDHRQATGKHGCYQVYNVDSQEMVLAVNNLAKGANHAAGIGNNPSTKKGANPDWTFANNLAEYAKNKERAYLTIYFLEGKAQVPATGDEPSQAPATGDEPSSPPQVTGGKPTSPPQHKK